ncbi:MAG: hypothetical protein ACOY82_18385 [Pseudomonadota bacterium]
MSFIPTRSCGSSPKTRRRASRRPHRSRPHEYIVTWNGGLNTGTYSIQIVANQISGATCRGCATTPSSG